MRFRTKQKPRGLIARKDQIRLTLMLLALGLVLVGSKVTGRTDIWARMFPETQPADTTDSETVITHTTHRPELTADSPESPVRILRDDLRSSIEDDVIGVSVAESKAWFVSMGLAERITAIEARKLPQARYALLMDAPDDCRGQAWNVTGTLRRLAKEKLTNTSTEYQNVVDAWLTLPDSGDGLVHVVALQAARDLPFAAEFDQEGPKVTLSGYFFKREAYASGAEGGLSIAPLLLAGSLSKVPAPVTTATRAGELTPWLGWLTFFTCATIALIVWSFASSDAINRGQRTHTITRLPSSPSFEGLQVETPHETLHQLETTAEAVSNEFNIEESM